jgi:hypothetical protein
MSAMSNGEIERVFGRGRLKMATGDHVEVFREAVAAGERRRYTKRFLATGGADFRQWTDREWRILARLIGHGVRCVPAVVQYHGGAEGGLRELQTYDAGVSVDQWATLLPVERDGRRRRSVFDDCAHWWALAHHCLAALEEIHALELVHLDVKADNLCIPFSPPDFDPADPMARLHVDFGRFALIDFAFSLVSRERLATSLPIGWQKDYDYQSPRLLHALEAGREGNLVPTQELDWRCDLYSLAAMLRRYLPDEASTAPGDASDWTDRRRDDARALVYRLRECHDREDTLQRPHRDLLELTAVHVGDPDLASSIVAGWTLVRDAAFVVAGTLATPMTRIAVGPVAPTRLTDVRTVVIAATPDVPTVFRNPRSSPPRADVPLVAPTAIRAATLLRPRSRRTAIVMATIAVSVALPFVGDAATPLWGAVRDGWARLRSLSDVVAARPKVDAPSRTDVATTSTDALAPMLPAQTEGGSVPDAPPAGSAQRRVVDDVPVKAEEAASPPATAVDPRRRSQRAATNSSVPPVEQRERTPETAARGAQTRPVQRGAGGTAVSSAARPDAPVAEKPAPPIATAERNAKRAVAANAAPSRAIVPWQGLVATPAAPVPYDPVAAQQATTRLAQQATRVTPQNAGDATSRDVQPAVPVAPVERQAATIAIPEPGTALPRNNPSQGPQDARVANEASRAQGLASAGTPPAAVSRYAESPPSARDATPPKERDRWRDRFQAALKALGIGAQAPAPVDDRRAQRSPAVPPAAIAAVPVEPAHAPTWALPGTQAAAALPPTQDASGTPPSRIPSMPRSDAPPADMGRLAAPAVPPPRTAQALADDDDLARRGRRLVAETVPIVAAQAWADAAAPLAMATRADGSRQRAYTDATNLRWRSETSPLPVAADAARARELYDAAHRAYTAGRKLEAVELDLRALAANPRDPDVAGFLAFLHLRTSPTRPETARQLALHALAVSGSRRGTRFEDWNTFAVASALTGRNADATRAYLLMLGLSNDAERSCRAVLRAHATFGEAMRPTVEALSQRIRRDGRVDEAPDCATAPS